MRQGRSLGILLAVLVWALPVSAQQPFTPVGSDGASLSNPSSDTMRSSLHDPTTGDALTLGEDAVAGEPSPGSGPESYLIYRDFDGSALPDNADVEGDSVPQAGSKEGVGYVTCLTEDGSAVCSTRTLVANDVRPVSCDQTAIINTASADETQLVALSGSTVIYVCGFVLTAEGAVDAQLVSGTGTTCQTGQTAESGLYALTADRPIAGYPRGAMRSAAGGAWCLNLSGAVQVNGELYYAQFAP